MARQSIFDMKVSKIYPLLLQKVERKGRSKEELDATIEWLTGYDMKQVDIEHDLYLTRALRGQQTISDITDF